MGWKKNEYENKQITMSMDAMPSGVSTIPGHWHYTWLMTLWRSALAVQQFTWRVLIFMFAKMARFLSLAVFKCKCALWGKKQTPEQRNSDLGTLWWMEWIEKKASGVGTCLSAACLVPLVESFSQPCRQSLQDSLKDRNSLTDDCTPAVMTVQRAFLRCLICPLILSSNKALGSIDWDTSWRGSTSEWISTTTKRKMDCNLTLTRNIIW